MQHGQQQQAALAVVAEELMQPLVAQALLIRATQAAAEAEQQASPQVAAAVLEVSVLTQGRTSAATAERVSRRASPDRPSLAAVVVLVQP